MLKGEQEIKMVWKKVGLDKWKNEEREVIIYIEESKEPEQYKYSAILESTFTVAGGSKWIAGSDKKSEVIKGVKKYIGEHP
jgi:hypothetical protein